MKIRQIILQIIAFSLILSSCKDDVESEEYIPFHIEENQTTTIQEYPTEDLLYTVELTGTHLQSIEFEIKELSLQNKDWYGQEFENILTINEKGEIRTKWPFLITKEIFPGGIPTTVTVKERPGRPTQTIEIQINIEARTPILDGLTVSLKEYEEAYDDSWVQVTKEEYLAIQSNYYQTIKVGTTDERIEEVVSNPSSTVISWSAGSSDGVTVAFIKNNIEDIHHRGSMIGFCYYNPEKNSQFESNVKYSNNLSDLFYRVAWHFLPYHSDQGMYYFIHKNEDGIVLEGKKYMAFFANKVAVYKETDGSTYCAYGLGDTKTITTPISNDIIAQGFYSSYRQR